MSSTLTSNTSLQEIVANYKAAKVRQETLNGRHYLVAPLSLIVPGVLNGSRGPLFYPPTEVAKNPQAWNGMPIVVNHPRDPNGTPVSARDPDVIQQWGIGYVFRAQVNNRLIAEGWFDIEHTRRVEPRILANLLAGKPIELSTGLFTDNEEADGTFNGRAYTHIARNYRPDHLAVLPDEVGACSLQDGCGVLVNRSTLNEGAACDLDTEGKGEPKEERKRRKKRHRAFAANGGQGSGFFGHAGRPGEQGGSMAADKGGSFGGHGRKSSGKRRSKPLIKYKSLRERLRAMASEEGLEEFKTPHAKIMPGGEGTRRGLHSITWRKRGGHAGANTIGKIIQKAKAAGFEEVDLSQHGSPDGSYVGSGMKFRHPDGHELSVRSTYGVVAADNSYSAELKMADKERTDNGGAGSGFFGHRGRPGEQGGSMAADQGGAFGGGGKSPKHHRDQISGGGKHESDLTEGQTVKVQSHMSGGNKVGKIKSLHSGGFVVVEFKGGKTASYHESDLLRRTVDAERNRPAAEKKAEDDALRVAAKARKTKGAARWAVYDLNEHVLDMGSHWAGVRKHRNGEWLAEVYQGHSADWNGRVKPVASKMLPSIDAAKDWAQKQSKVRKSLERAEAAAKGHDPGGVEGARLHGEVQRLQGMLGEHPAQEAARRMAKKKRKRTDNIRSSDKVLDALERSGYFSNQDGHVGPSNILYGGPKMAKLTEDQRKTLVDNLISNCGCQKTKSPWLEEDRVMLNALSDDKLVSLERQAKEKVVANAGTPAAAAAPTANTGTMTAEQWLAAAPEEIRSVVANAMRHEQTQKQACIDVITGNSRNLFSKEQLMAMPLTSLVPLAALAGGPAPAAAAPNYLGAAAPPTANQGAEFDINADVLPLPTMNWEVGAGDLTKIKQQA